MADMRILVVGGGGREHALCWKLAQSPRTAALWCVPGNPGTATVAENLPIAVHDLDGIVAATTQLNIDLVVVGPEEPLALGLADRLTDAGIPVCGPSAAAARIESSKSWAKDIMRAAGVPTAGATVVSALPQGLAALPEHASGYPVVLKADGLAAGKGVVIAANRDEATRVLTAFLEENALGGAGRTVLIEAFLTGREVSVFGLTDGDAIITLGVACDYKRVADGDTGPNTGGMGAFSPVGGMPADLSEQVLETMVLPTLHTLAGDGVDYRGVLYAGIMLTPEGPRLLEYNVRFGDPEAQVVLPRLDGDLTALLASAAAGTIDPSAISVRPEACVGVVLAAPGYPAEPVTGATITGLEDAGPLVFCAGVAEHAGRLVTAGGRVLCVAALGADGPTARRAAYAAAGQVSFAGGILRREDIAATA